MNAVITEPKAKTSCEKSAALVSAVYLPSIETSLCARLDTLQAALTQAEEHIESAFDAAGDGSAVEILLGHIGHALLADAMRPMMGDIPSKLEARKASADILVVNAALEGALALTDGASLHALLFEAYALLHWAHNECGSNALINLLPEVDHIANFNRGRDHAIAMMEECVATGDEREGWRWLREGKAQNNLVDGYLTDVIEDQSLRHGFTAVLSAALQNETYLSAFASMTLAEVEAGEIGANETLQFTGEEKFVAATIASTAATPSTHPEEVVGNLISHDAPHGQRGLQRDQELRRRLAGDACYELEMLVPLVVEFAHDHDTSGRLYSMIRGMMRRIGELNDVIFDAVITTEPNHTARVLCDKLGLSDDDMHREMALSAEVGHA